MLPESSIIETPAIILRWRNIAFDKDGKSYRGRYIYDTHDQAFAAILQVEREVRELDGSVMTLDGEIYPDEYSHAVPLPI